MSANAEESSVTEAAATRPVVQRISETVTIDKPLITEGADVFIACSTLEFTGSGAINTGYSTTARPGADALPAGNIEIIAHSIKSLRVKTTGQRGGDGPRGYDGSPGSDGRDGAAGHDARCIGNHPPARAGRGQDGERGGDGGTGGNGGTGGRGGAGGNVHIRFFQSDLSLTTVPAGADIRGAIGGAGGGGGSGGTGGKGGRPGAGGRGITCPRGAHGDIWDVYVDAGSAGDAGADGNRGSDGVGGLGGASGSPGQWLAERFPSEDAFYGVIARYLPSLSTGQLRKAELLFMLNQRPEAEKLLQDIAVSASGASVTRAQLLLGRFETTAPRNYYNLPLNWAPVLLKEGDDGNLLLKTVSDLRADLDSLRVLLKEASEIATYRSQQVYSAEQAIRAFEFEKRQIEDRLQDIRNRIDRAPADLAAMIERLRSLEAQAIALKDRIARLVQQIANLPTNIVSKGRDLLESVGSLATNIGAAIGAAGAQNWLLAGGFALNAIADLQCGLQPAQDLLGLHIALEHQINAAKQEFAQIGDQIKQANNEIRQLITRQAEDAISQDSLTQTRNLLTTFQVNQDVASLRQLQRGSEEALWHMRISVAEQLHGIRRYLDLRLGRKDAIQPMSPPGGIFDAFSYSHLLAILADIQRTVLRPPVPSVVDWDTVIGGPNFTADLERLSAGQMTSFAVTALPDFLKRARVRDVRVSVLDEEGNANAGYFQLTQPGGVSAFSETVSFDLEETNRIFRVQDGNSASVDQRFGFRSVASAWNLTLLSIDDPGRKLVSVRFSFKLELAGQTAVVDASMAESSQDDRPIERRTGSDAWLEKEKASLAKLVELRDAAIAAASFT